MDALKLSRSEFFPEHGMPLAVLRREPQTPFDRHAHDFDELVLVTAGSAVHLVDEAAYPVLAGDCFVLHQGDEHEFSHLDRLCLVNILFDPVLLGTEALADLPGFRALFRMEPRLRRRRTFESRLHLDTATSQEALGMIQRIEAELRSRKPGFEAMSRAVFTQLAVFLARVYDNLASPRARELLRVSQTLNFMDSCHQRPIRIAELAAIAHMSVRNYQRIFHEVEGITPSEYLLNLRILKARKLLERENRPVTAIAYDCGFSDSNYFTRVFHKSVGMTPREYRARQTEG